MRHYNPKKPTKWGFKVFVLADSNEQVYATIIYQGESTLTLYDDTDMKLSKKEKTMGKAPTVVIALVKHIDYKNITLYCDNYFTNIELFVYLKETMQVVSTGTFRSNRIEKCPLKCDKTLKDKGRGSIDYESFDNKFILVKFFDNKPVYIGSTTYGVHRQSTLRRYSKEHKKRIQIQCPNVVYEYNKNMGGVDKSNYLVSLYRLKYKSRKWYMPIFFYYIDICLTNAWLVYRKKQTNISYKIFRMRVADDLI